MSRRWSDRGWPPPSVPIRTDRGIKARSRRGGFADSWWGKRWLEVLEGFGIGARLRRGRSYARAGQVLEIEIEPGGIAARVQGSRGRPYRVTMAMEVLSEKERRGVAGALSHRPKVIARLLSGTMPAELEEIMRDGGAALFPDRQAALETECSCPDWSNPCKHIAAVHYLLAEELDRDPFLLLRFRGFERDDLLEPAPADTAADAGGQGVEVTGTGTEVDVRASAEPVEPPEAGLPVSVNTPSPLPPDPDAFWGTEDGDSSGGSEEAEGAGGGEEGSAVIEGVAVLRSLGGIPFWRGQSDSTESLAAMIGRAAALGEELLGGGGGVEHV